MISETYLSIAETISLPLGLYPSPLNHFSSMVDLSIDSKGNLPVFSSGSYPSVTSAFTVSKKATKSLEILATSFDFLAGSAYLAGSSAAFVFKADNKLPLESSVNLFDSENLSLKFPKADSTSFDMFSANIAMKTRYIRLIIFCLGVNFPPAIFSLN